MTSRWMTAIVPAGVVALASAPSYAAAPELVRPDPNRLRGELLPPKNEPLDVRLERQAAENVLLQYFGFETVGFAPYAARDVESLYPLVHDGVRTSLAGTNPGPVEIRDRLRALFVDESLRMTVKAHVAAVALSALQIPPHLYPSYPAAEVLQRQFAIYYTNELRTAADRIHGARHACLGFPVHEIFQRNPLGLDDVERARYARYTTPAFKSTFLTYGKLDHQVDDRLLTFDAGRWDVGDMAAVRDDISTYDPVVLFEQFQRARASWDSGYIHRLLLILLKMMVVEPIWTDAVWEGPQLPPLPELELGPCPFGQTFLPDGNVETCLDQPPYPATPHPRFFDKIACPEAGELVHPFVAEPDHRDPYMGTRTLIGRSLTADPVLQPGWNPLPLYALDVGAAADGATWIISDQSPTGIFGPDKSIHRKSADGGWELMPGLAVRISVGSHHDVAVVTAAGQIFRWSDEGWVPLPGSATDVGIAEDGSLWIVGTTPTLGGYEIYRWNGQGWTHVPGGAVKIDVGTGDTALVTNAFGEVFLSQGGDGWQFLGSSAVDVGLGTDRSIWRLSSGVAGPSGFRPQMAATFAWLDPRSSTPLTWWLDEVGGEADRIAVRSGKRLVVSNRNNRLFEYVPSP